MSWKVAMSKTETLCENDIKKVGGKEILGWESRTVPEENTRKKVF